MTQRVLAAIVAVAAALGFAFAAVSTSDFVAHLDRQVHGIHCSFLPGVGTADVSGTTGCHVTLMSPYSSVMRESVWGGIPISLPAMAVFAYLVFFPLALIALRRTGDRRATGFLLAATTLPLLTSIVMGWISLTELDAACKLCIGIYTASTIAFFAALGLFVVAMRAPAGATATTATRGGDAPFERMGPAPRIAARGKRIGGGTLPGGYSPEQTIPADETVRDPVALGHAPTIDLASEEAAAQQPRRLATASEMDRRGAPDRRFGSSPSRTSPDDAPIGWGVLGAAFALGIAFVVLPVVAYAANAPDFDHYLGACGTLPSPADPHRVLVPLGPQTRPLAVTEVLDPLCPACRGFEQRFTGLESASQVSRRALLFPLDSECNWMVDRPIHPGACAISEAILCAGDDAEDVLAWSFEEQEAIRTATTSDPGAAARMASARFPALARCIGSPEVRARLNRALRWAVANQLPVLTPQVYVGDTRICDADTDLGLDWTLARLLERSASR
ncbi:vitamin K epoxide reductase family protein [Sandaracinus amylolyticus]|uniref:Vitamin K epoxide reductase domain-containing protein n=1 Tax=Sandaracinus amylolyticus TaxID=927083 RepID=A0A0F6YPK7_9BACT|nr:vitamin K epoxide reductase family protein [Sandaracinus amylolyticus]AKF11582.1 hypothetical protein DB32_008731 [Sandaracinus amylolyticus]